MITHWLIAICAAYLVGSIPFGLLIGFAKGIDIRTQGSGNIGATNTLRLLGKKIGLTCFFLDVLKGAVPVFLAGYFMGMIGSSGSEGLTLEPIQLTYWLIVMVAAVLGHVFPVWLKFKGGKGVATGFGSILGFFPYLTLPAVGALLTFLVILKTTKYVSLGSIFSAILLPIYYVIYTAMQPWTFGQTYPILIVTGTLAGLITLLHQSNIKRLLAGTENKAGKKKESPES